MKEGKHSFEFGFRILQWLYHVNPFWLNSVKELFQTLTAHIDPFVQLSNTVSSGPLTPKLASPPASICSFTKRLKIISFMKNALLTWLSGKSEEDDHRKIAASLPPIPTAKIRTTFYRYVRTL